MPSPDSPPRIWLTFVAAGRVCASQRHPVRTQSRPRRRGSAAPGTRTRAQVSPPPTHTRRIRIFEASDVHVGSGTHALLSASRRRRPALCSPGCVTAVRTGVASMCTRTPCWRTSAWRSSASVSRKRARFGWSQVSGAGRVRQAPVVTHTRTLLDVSVTSPSVQSPAPSHCATPPAPSGSRSTARFVSQGARAGKTPPSRISSDDWGNR